MAPGAAAQTRGIAVAGALLHLFAFFADGGLQRAADALAISAILRRSPRSQLCHHFRHFPPAVFDEHAAFLGFSAAVPLCGAQRRDQYDRVESAVDARERAGSSGEAYGRAVAASSRGERQRFGELRQWL